MPVTNHDVPQPVLHDLTHDQKIAVLLAAYKKNGTSLNAIEAGQRTFFNLILGIYSAALTLLIALYKDERDLLRAPDGFLRLSALDWVLILAAALITAYSRYMSYGRVTARISIRETMTRIECAFGFFETGIFLKNVALYPPSFGSYARASFLQRAHYLLYAPAAAFVAAVVIFSRG